MCVAQSCLVFDCVCCSEYALRRPHHSWCTTAAVVCCCLVLSTLYECFISSKCRLAAACCVVSTAAGFPHTLSLCCRAVCTRTVEHPRVQVLLTRQLSALSHLKNVVVLEGEQMHVCFNICHSGTFFCMPCMADWCSVTGCDHHDAVAPLKSGFLVVQLVSHDWL
jgi:hypothetical protein